MLLYSDVCQLKFSDFSCESIPFTYTKSLVNTNLVNTNFTYSHFQKVPIPHLTRTMKQKFLH